jgi:hypothetical protein
MKLHDFGLWFKTCTAVGKINWSTTIPQEPDYFIYYDGEAVGRQEIDFDLFISTAHPHTLKLKENFKFVGSWFVIGRCLTMDDFEIIPNPDYE